MEVKNNRYITLSKLFDDYYENIAAYNCYKEKFENEDADANSRKMTSEDQLNLAHLLDNLIQSHHTIFNAISKFNLPGGEGFNISKQLLENYRHYKITLSNFIKEGDTCFETVRVKDEYGKLIAESLKKPGANNVFEFEELTDFLMNFDLQEIKCSKNLTRLTNSDKTPLIAPMLVIIEHIIKKMKDAKEKKIKMQGKILYEYYLSAKNVNKNFSTIASELNLSTRTFQRWKTDAITTFSEFLWGVDCIKNNLANIKFDTETKEIKFILKE